MGGGGGGRGVNSDVTFNMTFKTKNKPHLAICSRFCHIQHSFSGLKVN